MRDQRRLDLSRSDVRPAPDDHVGRPADDEVVAVFVASQQVTGSDPPVGRHLLARQLRHVIGGHRRGVAIGLAVVADQCRQHVQRVRLDDQLVVVGSEAVGHLAGIAQLVEVAFAEADREGLDRLRGHLGHLGDHRRRVHTATQEGA